MKIALVHDAVLPVAAYGGTERVVWWLSKALAARGHEVVLACAPGSSCTWAQVVHPDFSQSIEKQIHCDIFHYFNTPSFIPTKPYIVTIGGNGKPGEEFLLNTVFVSRNHARRHGSDCFVHNGVDPDEYEFSARKDGSLLFLAKASWRVKNVQGAIRLARAAGRPLHILGGSRWLFNHWRGIHWHGMLGGRAKAEFLARSSALLFPVLWNEPFGLAVVEALVSGTPVFATPWGSLPELIDPEVGRICEGDSDFLRAIQDVGSFRPERCREWALDHFSHHKMAEGYLAVYERVVAGELLNAESPVTRVAPDALQSIVFQVGAGSSIVQPI